MEFWSAETLNEIEATMSGGSGVVPPTPPVVANGYPKYRSATQAWQYNHNLIYSMHTQYAMALTSGVYGVDWISGEGKYQATYRSIGCASARGVNHPYPDHGELAGGSIEVNSSGYPALTFKLDSSAGNVGCYPPIEHGSGFTTVSLAKTILDTAMTFCKNTVVSMAYSVASVIAGMLITSTFQETTGTRIYRAWLYSSYKPDTVQYLNVSPTLARGKYAQWRTTYIAYGRGYAWEYVRVEVVWEFDTRGGSASASSLSNDGVATPCLEAISVETSDNLRYDIDRDNVDESVLQEVFKNNETRSTDLVRFWSAVEGKDSRDAEDGRKILAKHRLILEKLAELEPVLNNRSRLSPLEIMECSRMLHEVLTGSDVSA